MVALQTVGGLLFGYAVVYTGYDWFSKLRKWRVFWDNCGLTKGKMYPIIRSREYRPYGYVLKVSLPYGMSVEDFWKRQVAIEQFLNHRTRISYKNKHILIEVFERKLAKELFEPMKTRGLDIVVGLGHGGPMTINLAEGVHLLIAGETGSGKSNALRAILTNLALTKNIDLHLIDLKRGAEFMIFKDCPQVKGFCVNREEATSELKNLVSEVERRYKLFAKSNSVDIDEYNLTNAPKLRRKLVVIDEFALLAKSKNSNAISLVEELAAISRASGVHMIIATQRPDHEVVNGRIKANFPVVLGLKTANKTNSRIIIDENGLEQLDGRGHGILRYKGEMNEIQTMNLQPAKARELLAPIYEDREPTQQEKAEAKKVFEFVRQRK